MSGPTALNVGTYTRLRAAYLMFYVLKAKVEKCLKNVQMERLFPHVICVKGERRNSTFLERKTFNVYISTGLQNSPIRTFQPGDWVALNQAVNMFFMLQVNTGLNGELLTSAAFSWRRAEELQILQCGSGLSGKIHNIPTGFYLTGKRASQHLG